MADEDESMASGSESENDPQVESLVAGRQKRSTAANRYSALLQNEEPEDEVNMLFQEEEGAVEDTEFVGEDKEGASDVDMDSDDDEDDQGPTVGPDDMTGEKELEKAERAERRKKRKDQLNFKGRLNLKPRVARSLRQELATSKSTPEPRPKKKSERTSWLPTVDEGPVRSSSRRQTVQNKEVIHERMKASEKKRRQQAKAMEAAQKRREADKPKALSQADRMAEAHKIEKQNAKSLNRWETEERKRQEERQAKLDALKNRKLEGPVFTYWSGPSAWVGDRLVSVGAGNKIVEIKEPVKSKPGLKAKNKHTHDTSPETTQSQSKDQDTPMANASSVEPAEPVPKSDGGPEKPSTTIEDVSSKPLSGSVSDAKEEQHPVVSEPSTVDQPGKCQGALENSELALDRVDPTSADTFAKPTPSVTTTEQVEHSPVQKDTTLTELKQQDTPGRDGHTPSELAQDGSTQDKNTHDGPTQKVSTPGELTVDGSISDGPTRPQSQQPDTIPNHSIDISRPEPMDLDDPSATAQVPSTETPQPPAVKEIAARILIILENIEGSALTLPELRNNILVKGQKAQRRTAKEQKMATEMCALTGQVAKFRDPRTSLAYANSKAYKQIQNLEQGKCRWSNLLGCYVGPRDKAARGVPDGWFTGRQKAVEEPKDGEK